MTRARAAGWIAPGGRRIAVLMLAVLAFLVAEEVGVNYFVAAFVAGFAFRAGTGVDDEEATELPELIGRVLALAVWFVFGAGLLLDGLEHVDWRIVLYAVLSLTVVRMVPVAISMIGAGFSRPATAVHRLVRTTRPRLGRLRSPDRRGAPVGRSPGADRALHDRADGAAQRGRPRHQRPPAHGVAREASGAVDPRGAVTTGAEGGRRLRPHGRSPRSPACEDHDVHAGLLGGPSMVANPTRRRASRDTNRKREHWRPRVLLVYYTLSQQARRVAPMPWPQNSRRRAAR